MQKLSEEFIKKLYDEANETADSYIKSLYNLLQCIDLSAEGGPGKAHGILNMIEQIQKVHATLEKPATTHEERKDAFDLNAFRHGGR